MNDRYARIIIVLLVLIAIGILFPSLITPLAASTVYPVVMIIIIVVVIVVLLRI